MHPKASRNRPISADGGAAVCFTAGPGVSLHCCIPGMDTWPPEAVLSRLSPPLSKYGIWNQEISKVKAILKWHFDPKNNMVLEFLGQNLILNGSMMCGGFSYSSGVVAQQTKSCTVRMHSKRPLRDWNFTNISCGPIVVLWQTFVHGNDSGPGGSSPELPKFMKAGYKNRCQMIEQTQ